MDVVIYHLYLICNSPSLSDISKWNINNVNDMRGMFSNCVSLSSLPDLSKWNTNKDIHINDLFKEFILILLIL